MAVIAAQQAASARLVDEDRANAPAGIDHRIDDALRAPVSDAQPATASLVAEAARLLSTVGPPLTLVVNKMPANEKEARIDLDGLEELVPDAHGLVTIEDDQRAAQRVAAGDFAWLDAPDTWQRSVRQLAVALETDWPALGLSH